jgi:hypothetical protein
LELCLAPNQETQAVTASLFTQDSGCISYCNIVEVV